MIVTVQMILETMKSLKTMTSQMMKSQMTQMTLKRKMTRKKRILKSQMKSLREEIMVKKTKRCQMKKKAHWETLTKRHLKPLFKNANSQHLSQSLLLTRKLNSLPHFQKHGAANLILQSSWVTKRLNSLKRLLSRIHNFLQHAIRRIDIWKSRMLPQMQVLWGTFSILQKESTYSSCDSWQIWISYDVCISKD